jgi:uncharacterized protein
MCPRAKRYYDLAMSSEHHQPISNLQTLLQSMRPQLNNGVYVYVTVPHGTDTTGIEAIATFREIEGLTLITSETEAQRRNLSVLFRAAWITLRVHSDLQAVGLTAAFSKALGDAGISCNVVAAAYHDHIFVPVELAKKAMEALVALQQGTLTAQSN